MSWWIHLVDKQVFSQSFSKFTFLGVQSDRKQTFLTCSAPFFTDQILGWEFLQQYPPISNTQIKLSFFRKLDHTLHARSRSQKWEMNVQEAINVQLIKLHFANNLENSNSSWNYRVIWELFISHATWSMTLQPYFPPNSM